MTSYTDGQQIGSGGFGEVCICERNSDGEQFAKKKLTDLSPDAVARFSREVRLLSSLDHPHVVQVVAKRLTTAPYFYVMPCYTKSLDQSVAELAKEPHRIAPLFSRILDGVAYAHEQGVIHRDLKPQNILLNDDSDLVVSDFGLGRQLDSESTRNTGTGYQMGTVLYMAPEQFADSKSVDARCDVFGLGRMIIELYAGLLSPGAQDTTCIPARFLPIVRRATHQDADRRFASAVEMRNAWQQALAAGSKDADTATLQSLIAELSAEPYRASQLIGDLVDKLIACAEDPDEILAAIMKLPPVVVGQACTAHPDTMLAVVAVFTDLIKTQGFSFEYTDTLANHSVAICDNTSDAAIRARLAAAIAIVGADHNRWFVMGRAAHMLESVGEYEQAEFISEFADVSETTREKISHYLGGSVIPSSLRQLFDFS